MPPQNLPCVWPKIQTRTGAFVGDRETQRIYAGLFIPMHENMGENSETGQKQERMN